MKIFIPYVGSLSQDLKPGPHQHEAGARLPVSRQPISGAVDCPLAATTLLSSGRQAPASAGATDYISLSCCVTPPTDTTNTVLVEKRH
jgi:hypothetical protein